MSEIVRNCSLTSDRKITARLAPKNLIYHDVAIYSNRLHAFLCLQKGRESRNIRI